MAFSSHARDFAITTRFSSHFGPLPGMTYQTNEEAHADILSGPDSYSDAWIRRGDKDVAPVPAGGGENRNLVCRLTSGCREAGADSIHVVDLDPKKANSAVVLVPTSEARERLTEDTRDSLLIVTSNLTGSILVTSHGYALIAGSVDFLRGALSEGRDAARSRFQRYARKVLHRWPEAGETAKAHPPLAFALSSRGEVSAESFTGRQLALMDSFIGEEINAPWFARAWNDARRQAMAAGERQRGGLADALNTVFFALEDYSFDPDLWESGDLTDDDLLREVSRARDQLGPPRRTKPTEATPKRLPHTSI
ncbi:colicin immunity domain-containing protein [Streptomyces sp. NPDC054784]